MLPVIYDDMIEYPFEMIFFFFIHGYYYWRFVCFSFPIIAGPARLVRLWWLSVNHLSPSCCSETF